MTPEEKIKALATPELQEVIAYIEKWELSELQEQDVRDLAWEYGLSADAETYLMNAYVPAVR